MNDATARGRARSRPALALACASLGIVAQALLAGCSPTASSVVALTPPQAPGALAASPYIAGGPHRRDVLLSWLAGDSTGWRVWFSSSADAGASWTTPVAVSTPGESPSLDPESSPRLACDENGRVVILWVASNTIPGPMRSETRLRYARSLDGGRSWSEPDSPRDDTLGVQDADIPPNPAGARRDQTSQDLYLSRTGALIAAWLESGPGADHLALDGNEPSDASVHFIRSADFGGHWGPDVVQWSRACPGSRVRVVMDPAGFVYAAFRKRYGSRVHDVVLAQPGRAPRRVRADDWSSALPPRAGPGLVLSHDGTLRIAWFTGAAGRVGVWFRESLPDFLDSTGVALPLLTSDRLATAHTSIGDAGMSGTLAAIDADSTGERRLTLVRVVASGRRVAERFVVPESEGAFYPRVAADHTSQLAYVVWTATGNGPSQLKLCRWNVGH